MINPDNPPNTYALADYNNCISCVNSFPVTGTDISSYAKWCWNCWLPDTQSCSFGAAPGCWNSGQSGAACQLCLDSNNPAGECCGACYVYAYY